MIWPVRSRKTFPRVRGIFHCCDGGCGHLNASDPSLERLDEERVEIDTSNISDTCKMAHNLCPVRTGRPTAKGWRAATSVSSSLHVNPSHDQTLMTRCFAFAVTLGLLYIFVVHLGHLVCLPCAAEGPGVWSHAGSRDTSGPCDDETCQRWDTVSSAETTSFFVTTSLLRWSLTSTIVRRVVHSSSVPSAWCTGCLVQCRSSCLCGHEYAGKRRCPIPLLNQ